MSITDFSVMDIERLSLGMNKEYIARWLQLIEEGRKQGAKEELERVLNFYDDGKTRKTINISVAILKKRLSELEGKQ